MTIKWKVGRAVSFSENALNENRWNMKKYVVLCIQCGETKHDLLDFGFLAQWFSSQILDIKAYVYN